MKKNLEVLINTPLMNLNQDESSNKSLSHAVSDEGFYKGEYYDHNHHKNPNGRRMSQMPIEFVSDMPHAAITSEL